MNLKSTQVPHNLEQDRNKTSIKFHTFGTWALVKSVCREFVLG